MSDLLTDTVYEAARLCKANRELRREWARRMRLRDSSHEDFKELIEAAETHINTLVVDWCELQQPGGEKQ